MYYEELRRRGHRAARWWLVGDRLYYLGLLSALAAVPGAVVSLVAALMGFGWNWLVFAAVTFPVGIVVFFVGSLFKGYASTLGARDGISSAEVYARGGERPAPPETDTVATDRSVSKD